MKKLAITALIGAALLSCTKNDESIEASFNSSNKEVDLGSEQQRKLSALQARGYLTFVSLQSLEEKASSLRGTRSVTSSLANFFANQSVIATLEEARPSEIGARLQQTEAYKILPKEEQELILSLFNEEKVSLCIADLRRLTLDNKDELRHLTYGQFYHTPKSYKGTGAFIGNAAKAAAEAAAGGGGVRGAVVAFFGSMVDQLSEASSKSQSTHIAVPAYTGPLGETNNTPDTSIESLP